MSDQAPPIVQKIHVETTPDGKTTYIKLGTSAGDVACTLADGSFSLFLELLLKHVADIAAKAPRPDGPFQLLANPLKPSGIAQVTADNPAQSYLVMVLGNVRLTFQLDSSTLVQLSKDILEKLPPTPVAPEANTPSRTSSDRQETVSGSYSLRPSRSMPVTHRIWTAGPTLTYPELGVCAYCGTKIYRSGSDMALTDEHVIADGFGGTLVLPKATCEDHQKKTTTIEGSILRTIFLAPRARLGIRGRKKNRKGTTVFPVKATVDGREITIPLSLEEHPTVLYLLNLGPPGVLVGRPKQLGNINGVWLKAFNTSWNELQAKYKTENFVSDVTDTKRFYQFLAKTAHAFAVAELGIANFKPLLRHIIEGGFAHDRAQHLIGGYPDPGPPSDALHEIGLERRCFNSKYFAVAKIRFFANLGAPTYCIVVGEVSDAEANK